MRKKYTTLENQMIGLEKLSDKERAFLNKAFMLYAKKVDWNEFSNFYIGEIQKIFGPVPRKEIVKSPLFKVCGDLELRLGIEQGQTRRSDYRDALEKLIDSEFNSRYQFCRKANIPQDTLSRILNKKREPSLRLLNTILGSLGYELTFQRKQIPRSSSRPDSSKVNSPSLEA
jgi:transcriptional regulator with XRE-family HTH domain